MDALLKICSILLTLSIDLAVANGYGQRSSHLTALQKKNAFKWFFISQIFYKLALGFTKASILWLYIRIFITSAFQIVAYILLALVTCWAIGTIMATIFQCVPIQASWDPSIENAQCIDKDTFWYAFAAGNTATDFTIFLLPIYPIARLHLPWRDKIGLLIVLAIGAFVCATSIIRTVAVTQTSIKSNDTCYDFISRSIWTLVEANTGLICACAPMLKYYMQFFPCMPSKNECPGDSKENEFSLEPLSQGSRPRRAQKLSKPSDDTLLLRDSDDLSPEELQRAYASISRDGPTLKIEKTTSVSVHYHQ